MTDVSVIGLGAMGSALAGTLLKAGYTVAVWNRTAARAEPLVAAGAVLTNSVEEAVAASPATITCIASHVETLALLEDLGTSLKGKTIIELSTGGANEATALGTLLEENGAHWLIGIINEYPTGIGKLQTVLTVVGAESTWERWKSLVRTLGGGSVRVGTEAGMVAALFAALFTTRQGFMFGMIYGALLCQRAGIPLQTFAEQIPVSLGVLPSYHAYFSQTVPDGNFDDPPASMATYAAALDDALATFKTLDAPAALPQLFSDLAHRGLELGLEDKALTALVAHLETDTEKS